MRGSDLASMPGPSSITRITGEPSSRSTRTSDRTVLRGERDGVLDQLLQDAAGGQAVQAGHGRSRRRLDADALVAAGHLAGHVRDVGPLGQARLDRRLEALDEPGEVAGARDEAFQQLATRLLRRGAARQRLRHAEDHGHRRAELVAQAGDELVAAGRALQQRLLGDLELARAAALALQRLGQLLDDGRRELRRDDAAAGGGLPHGVEDLVAVGVLEHVARCSGHEHVADRALILQPGQGHDPQVRIERLEPARGLDAVHHGHPNVHQHDVGLGRGDQLQRLRTVARLPDHHEFVGVQERNEGVAEPGVVVHDQHADTLARGRGSPLHQHVSSVT